MMREGSLPPLQVDFLGAVRRAKTKAALTRGRRKGRAFVSGLFMACPCRGPTPTGGVPSRPASPSFTATAPHPAAQAAPAAEARPAASAGPGHTRRLAL